MRNEPRGIMSIKNEHYLNLLRGISEELREAEGTVDDLRDRKWECVRLLKDMGHDFTASREGMDVVLSAPPSMRF